MEKKMHKKSQAKKKISITKEEFDTLSDKAKKHDEYYDDMLRAKAELDNTKRRIEKEKEEFLKFANEGIILRLLPIVDNFDRAISSVKHTDETDAIMQGIKMVQKELHNLFKDCGVEQVKSVGEKFDPHVHEAIAVVETNEHPEDTIVEEIQTGYKLHGRLIRPAIVKVSKGGKA